MPDDKKSAEERYVRNLKRENSELQKVLMEMCDLISESERMGFYEIEVIHGTVVFLGCT